MKGVYRIEITKIVYAIDDDELGAVSAGPRYARDDGNDWECAATRLENGRALTHVDLDSLIHGSDGSTTVREALAMYDGR